MLRQQGARRSEFWLGKSTLINQAEDLFCAQAAAAEPIYGTAAAETTVWLLLEYPQPWRARAVTDNDLPTAVQDWLSAQIMAASTLPGVGEARPLFIKRGRRRANLTFYVAVAAEATQRLYRFELAHYADLLALDVAAIAAAALAEDDAPVAPNRSSERLFLVCTNGKRDRCCAKFGRPLYEALARQAAQQDNAAVWQCTHIGGHRYAPTLVVLPLGCFYGFVPPTASAELLASAAAERVWLSHFRGRACYTPIVQAADYFLRQATGELELGAFRLAAAEPLGGGRWQVAFAAAAEHYTVTLSEGLSEPLLASCGPAKFKPRPIFTFEQLKKGAGC